MTCTFHGRPPVEFRQAASDERLRAFCGLGWRPVGGEGAFGQDPSRAQHRGRHRGPPTLLPSFSCSSDALLHTDPSGQISVADRSLSLALPLASSQPVLSRELFRSLPSFSCRLRSGGGVGCVSKRSQLPGEAAFSLGWPRFLGWHKASRS